MNSVECTIFKMHFEYFSGFTKEHLCRLSSSWKINEEVFHADSLEEGDFFDHDSIN